MSGTHGGASSGMWKTCSSPSKLKTARRFVAGDSDALDGLVLDSARFFEGSSSIASDVVGCDDDGSTTEDAVEEIGG